MKMQAWIIERRIKVLTDPEVSADEIRSWLGDVDSDNDTIVVEDELRVSAAVVEFQEYQQLTQPLKSKKAKKQASTRKALPPAPSEPKTSAAELKCPEAGCLAAFKYAKALQTHLERKHLSLNAPKTTPVKGPTPVARVPSASPVKTLDKKCTSCRRSFVTTSKSKVLCDTCFYGDPRSA